MSTALALNPISGSLAEKVTAFQQIAAAWSSVALNGYDSIPKVMGGCWMADALGVHPAMYMNNVPCTVMDGKTRFFPDWRWELAIARSRIPGFRFEVISEDETECTIEASRPGGEAYRFTYTIAMATRQGLASKGAWSKNPQEMLKAKCAQRVLLQQAGDALMGLPTFTEGDVDVTVEPPSSGSRAEVVVEGGAASPAPAGSATGGEVAESSAAPSRAKDLRAQLMERIEAMYGLKRKQDLLDKIAELFAMMRGRFLPNGAPDPEPIKRVDHIGPVDAGALLAWLDDHGKPADEVAGADSTGADQEIRAAVPATPAGEVQQPEPPPAPPPIEPEAPSPWEALVLVLDAAKKKNGRSRVFLKEAKPGDGWWYLVDAPSIRRLEPNADTPQPIKVKSPAGLHLGLKDMTRLRSIIADEAGILLVDL